MTIESRDTGQAEVKTAPIITIIYVIFIFSIPFETLWAEEGGSLTVAKIIGYVLIAACFLQPKRCFKIPPKAVWWFALYFVFYIVIGLFQSELFYRELMSGAFKIAQMLVLLWISFNLMKDKKFAEIALLSLAISCAVISILQIWGITATPNLDYSRTSILRENPNVAGNLLGIGAVVMISFVLRKDLSLKTRFIVLCTVLSVLWNIVHTGSRGALVALTAGILIYALFEGSMKTKVRNAIIVLLCFGALFWFSVQYESALSRWQKTVVYGSLAGREFIYPNALTMILERPIAGWGPIVHYHELGSRLGEVTTDTHNLILWVLTEVGVIGSVPFILGLLLCFRSAWIAMKRDHNSVPLALLTTTLVTNMGSSWHYRKLFWVILALALSSPVMRGPGLRFER
jgi:O-antigen ligase